MWLRVCPFASCFNLLIKNESGVVELRSEFQAVKLFAFVAMMLT